MRVVDVTNLTKTQGKRRKLSQGNIDDSTDRRLVLPNARFLCEHPRQGLFVSKLYVHDRTSVAPNNLGHADLCVCGFQDYGVEELTFLAYLESYPYEDFVFNGNYERVWVEDDATRYQEGHETIEDAFERLFHRDLLIEQNEQKEDMMLGYTTTGEVIRTYPEGSEIWSPKPRRQHGFVATEVC